MALFLALAVFGGGIAFADIIPADQKTDWIPGSTVGVPGGIPNRTIIYKDIVTDLKANNTGATDVSAIINTAIANCPANQVVYVPAGVYRLSKPISSVASRGSY